MIIYFMIIIFFLLLSLFFIENGKWAVLGL